MGGLLRAGIRVAVRDLGSRVLLRGRIAAVIPLRGLSRRVVMHRGRGRALHGLQARRAMQRESQRLLRRRRASFRLLRAVHRRRFRILRRA